MAPRTALIIPLNYREKISSIVLFNNKKSCLWQAIKAAKSRGTSKTTDTEKAHFTCSLYWWQFFISLHHSSASKWKKIVWAKQKRKFHSFIERLKGHFLIGINNAYPSSSSSQQSSDGHLNCHRSINCFYDCLLFVFVCHNFMAR